MSKYDALSAHLKSLPFQRVPMGFDEIERIIGGKLPPVAARQRAWWSNNPSNNVMTKAWLSAGFRSEEVDMAGRRLVFSRVASSSEAPAPVTADTPHDPLAGLYGGLRGTVRIVGSADLTAPVGGEWSAET